MKKFFNKIINVVVFPIAFVVFIWPFMCLNWILQTIENQNNGKNFKPKK